MLSDIFNGIVFLFFKKKMLVGTCYDSHPTDQGTETYRAVSDHNQRLSRLLLVDPPLLSSTATPRGSCYHQQPQGSGEEKQTRQRDLPRFPQPLVVEPAPEAPGSGLLSRPWRVPQRKEPLTLESHDMDPHLVSPWPARLPLCPLFPGAARETHLRRGQSEQPGR